MLKIASQVHPVIASRLAEIAAVCEQFGVLRLEVFGSASGNGDTPFNPERSDVDLLISDETLDSEERMGVLAPAALMAALEVVLDRQVDVLYDRRITNRYLRQIVDDEREVIYDATSNSATAATADDASGKAHD